MLAVSCPSLTDESLSLLDNIILNRVACWWPFQDKLTAKYTPNNRFSTSVKKETGPIKACEIL